MIEKYYNFNELKESVNVDPGIIVDRAFPVETYARNSNGEVYNHDWEWVLVYHRKSSKEPK